MPKEEDSPLAPETGRSGARERNWGIVGGVVGTLAGGGSALVAIVLDGAPWYAGGPYPRIFASPELLSLDVYLLIVLLTGAGFSTAALVQARKGSYPRTDAFGAGILGLVLTSLAGTILFVRLLGLLGSL